MYKVFFLICFLNLKMMNAQTVLPLYGSHIPNSKPSVDIETTKIEEGGIAIVSNVSRPTLTVFLPPKEKANGTAVVICPGGGYWILAASHEGTDIAKKFNEMGVAAIVLKYRIPNDAWMINREIGPLQDAQQAIKTVRDSASKWGINPAKIGIMGFSAGGHLASTAGTHFNETTIPNVSNTSLRPDFMVLIYPVISFMPPIAHTGSAEQLLGKNASTEKLKAYSGELQVTAFTPPSFLVHASDDDGVSVQHSVVFYNSLIQQKVSAELHIYQAGGHGFGMHIKGSEDKWMDRCANWMRFNGWMKK
jgi:acetyl esterase/lipase